MNFIAMIFENLKPVYIRKEINWCNAPVIILGYVAFDSQIRGVNVIRKLLQA